MRKPAKDCWNGRGNDNLGWNGLQMYFKVIKSGTDRKLVYDFLLELCSNFCRITHCLREIWRETVWWPWNIAKVIDIRIIWKHWKQTFDFLLAISVSVDLSYIISEILDLGGWKTLKYHKVIKNGTNRNLVYDFLLVVYSNFCRITHRSWKIWCETVQWPRIIASHRQSHHVKAVVWPCM